MARKAGQLISRGLHTWLVCVSRPAGPKCAPSPHRCRAPRRSPTQPYRQAGTWVSFHRISPGETARFSSMLLYAAKTSCSGRRLSPPLVTGGLPVSRNSISDAIGGKNASGNQPPSTVGVTHQSTRGLRMVWRILSGTPVGNPKKTSQAALDDSLRPLDAIERVPIVAPTQVLVLIMDVGARALRF